MGRKANLLGWRKVNIAVAPSDKTALGVLDQFTKRRIESVRTSNPYRRTAPQVVRDDIEIGLPRLALLFDDLSQIRPVVDVDVRRESIVLV